MSKTVKSKVKKAKKVYTEANPLVAYKGFKKESSLGDKGLFCREHEFKLGQVYSVTGKVKTCANGYHACVKPHHILDHYNNYDDESVFGVVHQWGDISGHSNRDKHASQHIKVIRIFDEEEFNEILSLSEAHINYKKPVAMVEPYSDYAFINKVDGAVVLGIEACCNVISEAKNATLIGEFNSWKGKLGCTFVCTIHNKKVVVDGKTIKEDTKYVSNSLGFREVKAKKAKK